LITVGNIQCQVSGATLTSEGEHVSRYKLDPGATEVKLHHPKKQHSFLNEVIFK